MIFGSPPIVTNGLVLNLDAANMKSYPKSGTTWRDLSGFNNSGSLTNGPTFNSANGGSIVFDGVNDYVGFNTSASISTLAFSISCVVSVDTTNLAYMRFISKGNYGFTPGYLLQRFGEVGGLRFSLGIGSATSSPATSTFVYTTDTYQPNQTYYLTMVSTGTYLYLYVNNSKANLTKYTNTGGTLENNTDLNYTAINSGLSITTSDKFSVGAYSNASTAVSEYLNGKVFNVRAYNRALSPSEVAQNYNAQKSRFNLQ